jgi:SAM-dependent methyltransferase
MIRAILRNGGIRPGGLMQAISGWSRYAKDRAVIRAAAEKAGIPWGRELPILTEWNQSSGSLGAYFRQDQLVARWIHADQPERHVDVGSRLDGFIGHLSVFRDVDVIDIRPQPHPVHNVRFHQLDLMQDLPGEWIGCTPSLSCLHTIEHFGLGRYGDALDLTGHLKGLEQLKKLVRPGGCLYLSTPIGPERIEFNAHRVFAAETLTGWFSDGWTIERFAVIDDADVLHENLSWDHPDRSRHFGCTLGVGILTARRHPTPEP